MSQSEAAREEEVPGPDGAPAGGGDELEQAIVAERAERKAAAAAAAAGASRGDKPEAAMPPPAQPAEPAVAAAAVGAASTATLFTGIWGLFASQSVWWVLLVVVLAVVVVATYRLAAEHDELRDDVDRKGSADQLEYAAKVNATLCFDVVRGAMRAVGQVLQTRSLTVPEYHACLQYYVDEYCNSVPNPRDIIDDYNRRLNEAFALESEHDADV
jgi:hypothetical protein